MKRKTLVITRANVFFGFDAEHETNKSVAQNNNIVSTS